MSDLINEVRELQRIVGNFPARFGALPNVPIDGIYQTIPDPGNNYPQPPQANTFYAQKVLPSFSHTLGNQGFDPPAAGGQQQNQTYIFNLSGLYIPQGTFVPCWNINSQLFTQYGGLGLFYGRTTAASVGPGVNVYVSSAINGPSGFTSGFDMEFSFALPINWPVIGIGVSQGPIWLVWSLSLYQLATLNTDIAPGSTGLATLQNVSGYGQVTVVDQFVFGGMYGSTVKLFYSADGWILEDSSLCV